MAPLLGNFVRREGLFWKGTFWYHPDASGDDVAKICHAASNHWSNLQLIICLG